MQKTKSFKLEGYDKRIEVKEISVKQILKMFDQKKELSYQSLLSDQILPVICNLELNEIIEMTPREINEIWVHFKELNKFFFVVGQLPVVKIMIEKLQKAFISDFSKMSTDLLKLDILE